MNLAYKILSTKLKSGIENAYQAGCRQIIVVNSANNKKEYEKMPGVIKVIDDFKELL